MIVHIKEVSKVLNDISLESLRVFFAALVEELTKDSSLFIAGNGGSQAISQHLATDVIKVGINLNKSFKVTSLGCNPSLMSALSNDINYESALLEELKAKQTDSAVVLLISSSGNSQNLINLAEYAREENIKVFALTGFSGAKIATKANHSIDLNLPQGEYEVVEDIHSVICHAFTRYLKIHFNAL